MRSKKRNDREKINRARIRNSFFYKYMVCLGFMKGQTVTDQG
jgi:hypothetical protein